MPDSHEHAIAELTRIVAAVVAEDAWSVEAVASRIAAACASYQGLQRVDERRLEAQQDGLPCIYLFAPEQQLKAVPIWLFSEETEWLDADEVADVVDQALALHDEAAAALSRVLQVEPTTTGETDMTLRESVFANAWWVVRMETAHQDGDLPVCVTVITERADVSP